MTTSSPQMLRHPAVRLLLLTAAALALRTALITRPPGFGASDLLPSYLYPHLLVEHGPAHVYRSMGFARPEAAPADVVELTRRYVGAAWYPTAFMYHPWLLVALVPLALATSWPGFLALFQVLNALAAVDVGLSVGRLLGMTPRERALVALLASLAVPFTDATALGQNTVILAALALRALRGLLDERAPTRGELALLLGVAFLKPWAPLLLLVPALARRWATSAGLVVAYVALGEVLPRLVLPGVLWSGWRTVQGYMEQAALLQHNNGSVRAFLTRLVPAWHVPYDVFPAVPTPVWWAEKVVAVVVAAAALGLALHRRPPARDAVLAGLCLVLVPLGTLWVHYTVLLVPGAAWLAWTRRGAVRAVGAIAVALLVTAPNHTLFEAWVPTGSTGWKADPGWALLGLTPWLIALLVGLLLLATRPVGDAEAL